MLFGGPAAALPYQQGTSFAYLAIIALGILVLAYFIRAGKRWALTVLSAVVAIFVINGIYNLALGATADGLVKAVYMGRAIAAIEPAAFFLLMLPVLWIKNRGFFA